MDANTGEGRILVDDAGFAIRGMNWNLDGTQFLYWRQSVDEWSYEGDIWIYDIETDEARPLNEIGSFVGWLN